MKNRSLFLMLLAMSALMPSLALRAQTPTPTPTFTRPRVVNPAQTRGQQTQLPSPSSDASPAPPTAKPTPLPAPQTDATPAKSPTTTLASPTQTQTPVTVPTLAPPPQTYVPVVPLQPARTLSASKFRASVAEAQRLLRSRLTPTAMTPNVSFVTIAALDHDSSKIHLLTVLKQTFLTRGAETVMATSQGLNVRLQIVRPNYVNTALVVSDVATGRQLWPLVVEYPIEKGGAFREMAYYTAAHPALVSPELVKTGQAYVHTMLDLAAQRLKGKGQTISPEIVDIAERLCVVEHVDHDRFRREDRTALYSEVYGLFALNELDTYRYSVSSAGAGGMVQMIPSTYFMLRRLHPGAGLNPDFVAGMRNHGNALEAMLLHMQDNWNELSLDLDVQAAMANKQAMKPELVASGYNSNSAKLPGYIRRGGADWRYLIPRETQMYLQIYKSVESLMPFKDRAEKK
ncbi:MAG: hypothetical protein LC754_06950 [Acidobacteria bacterium]|nr:hypothetical protein [Acidobacteriota bacterium]